jgi:His Kinase A (phospho-acceptor) domain
MTSFDQTNGRLPVAEQNAARPKRRSGHENRRLQSRRQLIEAFSHDVRTPLTVISQYLDLLDDELSRADPEEQRQIVRVMRDRAGDLNHTFNNLLDALKVDVGKLGSSRRACKAVDLTAAVRSILERKAIALSRTVEFDFASSLAPTFCDADQICRVLVNLAVDALKGSSSQDGVTVWATPNGVQSGVRVGVTVRRLAGGSAPPESNCQRVLSAGAPNSFFGPFGATTRVMRAILRRNLTSRVRRTSDTETCVSIDLPGMNPEEIVSRFLGQKRARSDRESNVTFVQVAPAQSADHAPANEVLGLISLVVRLRDLVLPLNAESWLVAFCRQNGASQDFRERLQATWEAINRMRRRSPLPPLRVHLLGNWRSNDHIEPMLNKLRTTIVPIAAPYGVQPVS